MKMDIKSIVMGISFALMWSSAFTAARVAVAYAAPLHLLAFRFLISGILALVIARLLGEHWSLSRRQWFAVIMFGIFQNGIYLGTNFVAMQWIEANLAAIIASLLPLLVAGAGWMFLGEKLTKTTILGLLAGTAGVMMIMVYRLSAGAEIAGVILCFVGVAALTFATLLVRGITRDGNVISTVGFSMLAGSAALFVAARLGEPFHWTWSWPLVISFGYSVLIAGLAATLVWFYLVRRIGPTRAATFHFLNPFFGVVIAAIFVNESLTFRDVLGVVIISLGILLVQVSRLSKPVNTT